MSPYSLSALAWIAFLPWFFSLRRCTGAGAAAVQGAWLSVFTGLGVFYFLPKTLQGYLWLTPAKIAIAYGAFCLLCQPQFYILSTVQRWVSQKLSEPRGAGSALALIFGSALLYSGTDWLIPKVFSDTLGLTLVYWPRYAQLADLGGPALLTFGVFTFNLLLFSLFFAFRSGNIKTIRLHLAILCLGVLAAAGYGEYRRGQYEEQSRSSSERLRVALIQTNILGKAPGGTTSKMSQTIEMIHGLLEKTSRAGEAPPELIFMPETSLPSSFPNPGTLEDYRQNERWLQFVDSIRIPVLFGAPELRDGMKFNSLFRLKPLEPGERRDISKIPGYRKHLRFPFAEYMPNHPLLRPLAPLFAANRDLGAGTGPETLELGIPGRPLLGAPAICYEAIFPWHGIEGVRKGGRILMNATSDEWFDSSLEANLHFAFSAIRSIETRVPQLRVANTGHSGVILADGSIPFRSPINQEDASIVEVPLVPAGKTLMLLWGDWFPRFAVVTGALLLLFLHFRMRPTREIHT